MKRSLAKSCTVILTLLALTFSAIGVTPAHADSIITVNSWVDNTNNDGVCTLREAIDNANNNAATHADCAAGSGNDTIVFDSSVGTAIIQVNTLGVFTISDSAGLTIDGDNRITLSGYDSARLFIVNSGATLTLKNIDIVHGYANGGDGGAIYNYGTLIIDNSKFLENHTTTSNSGGAIISQG